MDALAHVLLGVAVTGELTPVTVAASLAPDIGALPLQVRRIRENIDQHPDVLLFYRFTHSPAAMAAAWLIDPTVFVCVTAHILADMVTHNRPYSDFPGLQWSYSDPVYRSVVLILGVAACARLFF